MAEPFTETKSPESSEMPNKFEITGIPKFELANYISNYEGHTRFERLYYIGTTSKHLAREALKMAVAEAKAGVDVEDYLMAVEALRRIMPNDPDAKMDTKWEKNTNTKNEKLTTELQHEIKTQRSFRVKESSRIAHLDLGRHFEAIGHIHMAIEQYGRVRLDSTKKIHTTENILNIAQCGFRIGDYSTALSQFPRIDSYGPPGTVTSKSSFHAILGLTRMAKGLYHEALDAFLEVETAAKDSPFKEFATPTDIAIYTGLLALAYKPRIWIEQNLLNSQKFRSLLALEPTMRKVLVAYSSGIYNTCLRLLDENKTDYQHDLYIGPHVHKFITLIRRACIGEYCKPFSTMRISSLERALGTGNESLFPEIKTMILDGYLKMRLNTVEGVITAIPETSSEDIMYDTCLKAEATVESLRKAVRYISLRTTEPVSSSG